MTSTDPTAVEVPILVAEGLTKTFPNGPQRLVAVADVSFEIAPGEVVALAGPSGSGKSTLIDLVVGWRSPDVGEVRWRERADRRSIAVVPQDLGLLPELTALENVELAARAAGRHREGAARATSLVDALDLAELVERLPDELSLGQQQRVAVARALAADAALIVADEPTSHQDEDHAADVFEAFRNAAGEGAGVLLTSHDPRIVDRCDRVLEIVDGRLVGTDPGLPPPAPNDGSMRPTASLVRPAVVVVALSALVAGLLWFAGGRSSEAGDAASSSIVAAAPIAADEAPEDRFGSVETVEIASESLDRPQDVTVFLPPGVDDLDELPTLYLLHGQNDGPAMFERLGLFRRAASLMRAGEIEPMVIVAPNIDNSFGVSNPTSETVETPLGPVDYDGGDYEGFLIDDLIGFVEATYPVSLDPEDRRIGGISMGGFAALHLALRHPGSFARVGAHSPALVDAGFTWLYPTEAIRRSRDPVLLAKEAADADLAAVEIRLDAGRQDRFDLEAPIAELAAALGDAPQVEVVISDGQHDYEYWRRNVDRYLRFYGEP